MEPCFAIIDRNTLSYMALKHVLQDMFSHVEVFAYNTVDEFVRDSNRHFVHFFVSSDILFLNADEFEMLKQHTTVLSTGPAPNIEKTGYKLLDISLPEEKIAEQLKLLLGTGRYECSSQANCDPRDIIHRLSQREKDVLRLIVMGKLNKEVAHELNITLATAIFHRNNICDKLQTRSVGKMTVLAVISGLVDINEI